MWLTAIHKASELTAERFFSKQQDKSCVEITLPHNPHEDQPLRFYHSSKVIPPTAGTNATAFTSLSGGKNYFKFIDRKK